MKIHDRYQKLKELNCLQADEIIKLKEQIYKLQADFDRIMELSPKAFGKLQQGLQDTKDRKIRSLGDFTVYLEEEE